ncbi:MAG: NUDIX domain-containing protein [Puniceicoccaceae bacterium]
MSISLRYCPACGEKHFQTGDSKPWHCPDCGLDFFQNTAAAAGALVCDEQNRLLMVQRAKDPSKGKWGLPGGFIDAGESVEQALLRECREEIGIEIESPIFLCSFPNRYAYKGIVYATIDLYFRVQTRQANAVRALDEVAQIGWFDPAHIDPETVAFPSCVRAIECLNAVLGNQADAES